MIRKYLQIFGFWAVCWISVVQTCQAAPAIDQLNGFLQRTRSLSAEFVQLSIDESGKARQRSSGRFYLAKPGKFRWDYLQPYRQEIVANGQKVWFFDADLEQVTVKRLNAAIGSTPALLLTGEVGLEENFVIEEERFADGMQWVKLTPRSEDNSFKYIMIGIDGETLRGMELSDNFGQLTRIAFSNIKSNIQLEPSMFEFVAPTGVDVFED